MQAEHALFDNCAEDEGWREKPGSEIVMTNWKESLMLRERYATMEGGCDYSVVRWKSDGRRERSASFDTYRGKALTRTYRMYHERAKAHILPRC